MIAFIQKLYIPGTIILIGAIIINIVAKSMKLPTWYDFLQKPEFKLPVVIWLFIVYPTLLGLLSFIASRVSVN